MGSRGSSDATQRPSPRAPLHLRSTACSEANNAQRRAAAADRSPKVSPRGGSQEQRKRSTTAAAELETKLRETQAELKKLREQLTVAEAAKREVEQALVKVKVRVPGAALAKKRKDEEAAISQGSQEEGVRQNDTMEESVTSPATMDVFEVLVPAESIPTEDEADSKQEKTMVEKTETNENDETISTAGEEEEGEKKEDGKKREDEEVGFWKAKLLEKEKEVAILLEENVIFKTRAEEEAQRIAESSRSKLEEFTAQLNSIEEQLREGKTKEKQLAAQLAAQLETAEGTKATLEVELKRLKVQTEQWRKAAEAAAAALATGDATSGDETGGRRVTERCGSMDKHLGVGYGSWASSLADQDDVDEEDGGGGSRGGRRKAAGVRMFGNLWKKKQHKRDDTS